jgi:hypothetical protein
MLEFVMAAQMCALCVDTPIRYFKTLNECTAVVEPYIKGRTSKLRANSKNLKPTKVRFGYLGGKLKYQYRMAVFPIYYCTRTWRFNQINYNIKPPKGIDPYYYPE